MKTVLAILFAAAALVAVHAQTIAGADMDNSGGVVSFMLETPPVDGLIVNLTGLNYDEPLFYGDILQTADMAFVPPFLEFNAPIPFDLPPPDGGDLGLSPEPSTLALGGLGAGILAWRMRRRVNG